jgi:O-antigen/teichoic acid export membrane protein
MFANVGLAAATVQRRDLTHEQASTLFWVNAALGILLALVVMALAPVLAWIYADPRLLPVTVVLATTLALNALVLQHRALLQRQMRWSAIQAIQLVAMATGSGAAVLLALSTSLGYWSLVIGQIASALIAIALFCHRCAWYPGRFRWTRDVRQMVVFGGNLTGFDLLNFFNRRFDDLLIGWAWGAAAVGLYSRAYQLLLLPIQQINGPIAAVMLPGLSRLQGDPRAWRALYLDALFAIVLLSAPIGAAMILFAADIILVLLGDQWTGAIGILSYLALSLLVQPILNSTGWLYVSLGRADRMLRWAFFATPVIVASFLVGLPHGPEGVALAYSVAIIALTLPCLGYAFHGTPLRLGDAWRVSAPQLACVGLAAGATLALRPLTELAAFGPLMRLTLGLTVYAICCAALLYRLPRSRRILDALLRARHPMRLGRADQAPLASPGGA